MRTLRFELATFSVLLLLTGPVAGGVIHDVTVSSNSFTPSNLSIDPGDTVRWTNVSGFHNVDADDGAFRSGDPASPPWEFSFTFSEIHAGANPYHCDVHGGPGGAGMSGVINVTGGEPEYSSNPANGGTIQFGSVEQGDTGNATLTVNNLGAGALEISDVVISNDTADIFDVNPADTSFSVAQNASHVVDFSCSPTLATPPGQKTQAQATVSTNDSDESNVDYTLECNVTEAPEPVDVDLTEPAGDSDCFPGSCDFGEVEEGMSSAPKAYTLTNNGQSTVSGFGIQVNNANFQQTNACAASLSAGSQCSINVSFAPLSPGAKSATLSVSGGGISPAETSGLSGTGTAAPGDDDDDDFNVNFGITGSWANFLTLGQGWLFEIIPGFDPPVMVAYNFTYPPSGLVQKGENPEFFGNQMWLVGAGEIDGNTVTIMSDRPIAGAFDSAEPPPFFPDVPYATFIFTFFDCFNGMVEYDIPSKNLTGEYEIERITPDVFCEDLAAP